MLDNLAWPLMNNNITRDDLDLLINYLKQSDPKLTHGPKVFEFEEEWRTEDRNRGPYYMRQTF